jgi:hypothetical protein
MPSTSARVNGAAKRPGVSVNSPPRSTGSDQVVIAVGKVAWRKARPTSAGLNTFWPSPPQMSFPNPIATTPPRKAIQRGSVGGRVSASSTPVTTAL